MKTDLVILRKMADLTSSVISNQPLALTDSYICYPLVTLYEQRKIHMIFKVITAVLK
jgi:hypothetical protein